MTVRELFFRLYIPKKEFRIPIASISGIQVVQSHLGKKISRPLLKVLFTNKTGSADSIAWYVPNFEQWRDNLLALMQKL